MKNILFFAVFLLISAALIAAEADKNKEIRKSEQSFPLENATSVSAKVNVSVANVIIEKTGGNDAFAGEFSFLEEPPRIEYRTEGDEGKLRLHFGESVNHNGNNKDIDFDEFKDWVCRLAFTDRVPLSLDFKLEIAKADWDLGGFQISELEIASAVSDLRIDFSKPNPIRMDDMDIESGVGEMTLRRIGNANIERLDFEGGLGEYTFYFDGKMTGNMSANLEIGMGKLTIYLPQNIGVRIRMEDSFLTSVSVHDMRKNGDYYTNALWNSNRPQLDIRVDAGVSKVEVEWLD